MHRGHRRAPAICGRGGACATRIARQTARVNAVTPELLDQLRALLSPDRVLTRDEDVLPYGFDGTAAIKQRPGAVVFPLTTEEVAGCVCAAREAAVPVVTRGSGTGLSGGSVPLPGCLVLCLARMD